MICEAKYQVNCHLARLCFRSNIAVLCYFTSFIVILLYLFFGERSDAFLDINTRKFEGFFSVPLSSKNYCSKLNLFTNLTNFAILHKRYDKILIYHILNFGRGPIIFRWFQRKTLELRAAFVYFDDGWQMKSRLIPEFCTGFRKKIF